MLAAAPRGVPPRVTTPPRVATLRDYIDAREAPTITHPGALAPRRAPFPWGRPDIPAEGSARTARPPKGPLLPADLYPAEVLMEALVPLP